MHKSVLERIKIWSWILTGPKTVNASTGEGRQQIIVLLCSAKLVLNYSATNVAPTQKDQSLLPSKRTSPLQNMQVVLEQTKIWSWIPTGIKIKNDCAGQQQITALL
jgi:hypothetical protein